MSLDLKTIITAASICTGIVSAALWVKSATVTVRLGEESQTDRPWMSIPAGTTGKSSDINVLATAKAQGKWNSMAAFTGRDTVMSEGRNKALVLDL